MYLEHFNLKRYPFDQLPDPEFLYLAAQHDEALARMQFAIAINDSFTIITGEVGSGKTTLVRKLLSDMSSECTPTFVTHTRLNAEELLQMILVGLGVKPFRMGKTEMLIKLQEMVDVERQKGRRIVIVVDEGQNFSVEMLEELRLLTCMDTEKSKSINIVLIGQPQLHETLQSPDLDQLRQRCRLRFHLSALSEADTEKYIRHRLQVAGGIPDEIFDERALSSIYGLTRGIPRLVNTLCDTALIMAYIAKRDTVTMESIDDAVNELGWSDESPAHGRTVEDELDPDATGHLTITSNGQVRGEYVLDHPSYVIGRDLDCSIVIQSKYLSRHHALLIRDAESWMVLDLKSTNGITVNGREVQFSRLRENDVVGLGEHLMKLTAKPAAKPLALVVDEQDEMMNELPDLNA